jgi:hypothetical protein
MGPLLLVDLWFIDLLTVLKIFVSICCKILINWPISEQNEKNQRSLDTWGSQSGDCEQAVTWDVEPVSPDYVYHIPDYYLAPSSLQAAGMLQS